MMKSRFINALDLAVTPSSMDGGTPARVAVVSHHNSGGNPVSSMVAQKMVTSTPDEPSPINRHDLAKAIEEQLKTILKIGIVDNTANMAVSKPIAKAKGSSPTGDEIHDIVWYREDAHENKYQKVNSLKKFNRNGSNGNANAGTTHWQWSQRLRTFESRTLGVIHGYTMTPTLDRRNSLPTESIGGAKMMVAKEGTSSPRKFPRYQEKT